MNARELWSIIRPCFEEDDGSLPSFELRGLGEQDIARIYDDIRKSSRIANDNPVFWDIETQTERHLDDVPNAAVLVPARKAEPFHFAVEDFKPDDTIIPCLGVFIFQDIIEFDYKMGPHWKEDQVFALFCWLRDIIKTTECACLIPCLNEGPPDSHAFTEAWRKFLADK